MKESQIAGVLTPILAQFGLELEAVEIIPAGQASAAARCRRRRWPARHRSLAGRHCGGE